MHFNVKTLLEKLILCQPFGTTDIKHNVGYDMHKIIFVHLQYMGLNGQKKYIYIYRPDLFLKKNNLWPIYNKPHKHTLFMLTTEVYL